MLMNNEIRWCHISVTEGVEMAVTYGQCEEEEDTTEALYLCWGTVVVSVSLSVSSAVSLVGVTRVGVSCCRDVLLGVLIHTYWKRRKLEKEKMCVFL